MKNVSDFLFERLGEMAAFMTAGMRKTRVQSVPAWLLRVLGNPYAQRLYDTEENHVSAVAIVNQGAATAIGAQYQQDVDLNMLFKGVAKDFVTTVSPLTVRHSDDRATRFAKVHRSVTCTILPKDEQEMKAVEKLPHDHTMTHRKVGYHAPTMLPHDINLQRAFDASQDLPDFSFARYAEIRGCVGMKVDKCEDIGSAWNRALRADRPAVLDALVDRAISSIPPHISFKQANDVASALAKGDPDEFGTFVNSAESVPAGIFL